MKKVLLVLVGAVLLVAALAPAALAANDPPTGSANPEGTGTLRAVGSGTVLILGTGTVSGSVRLGTLTVKGAEHVSVEGYGKRVELPDGAVRYVGVHGEFRISGQDLRFELRGRGIDVKAAGKGEAFLRGTGRYWVNGDLKGRWPGLGKAVPIG